MMPDQSDLYNHLSGRAHLKMFATIWKSDPKRIDETNVMDFTFGKVMLNDLYALYYHDVV